MYFLFVLYIESTNDSSDLVSRQLCFYRIDLHQRNHRIGSEQSTSYHDLPSMMLLML